MDFKKDYYKLLGVSADSTREVIKAAYRKLVMQYHPDRNQGNEAAVEFMKEINEAYETLGDELQRSIYDEYRKKAEIINEATESDNAGTTKNQRTNKRTYTRKTTQRTERKIYVKGTLTVKFWAEQEGDLDLFIMRETVYRVNPVTATADITQSDIHDLKPPSDFEKIYGETELFKSPLPNPIRCKIVTPIGVEEYYDLNLQDVRIINPELSDIVKHEKQSLGTLTGEFYGYVLRVDEKEVIEEVSECFGETGKTEHKTENGTDYIRKEYYHKDCTAYWAPWTVIPKAATKTKKATKTSTVSTSLANGCSEYWWIPVLLLVLLISPQFFLALLGIGLIIFLFSIGASLLSRILPIVGLLLVVAFIYSAFRSGSSSGPIVKRLTRPLNDTIVKTIHPVVDTLSSADNFVPPDTLISHEIKWNDYDSNSYSVILSISVNALKKAGDSHNDFRPNGYLTSLAPVYEYLGNSDNAGLQYVYGAFDSIRRSNSLDELSFAKMVVSCIQSIPYYLVVDRSCLDDYPDDEYVNKYLEQCNRECCVGDIRYGVRSPLEFMSDLKGDCDTRALVIYNILKRFNYSVALLTSDYYKHAVIAVNFENTITTDGLAMGINNKNYFLWETTSTGFAPGDIPPGNRNLSYWEVALLNEKL